MGSIRLLGPADRGAAYSGLVPGGVDQIRKLISRGELLRACDEAADVLAAGDDSAEIRYLYVLALARSGATPTAESQFEHLGLAQEDLGTALGLDIGALGARLAKDRALATGADPDPGLAAEAALRYEAVHGASGDPYPGINAATMWMAANQADRSRELAERVLGVIDTGGNTDLEAYWAEATRAEAALLLGHVEEASAALVLASERNTDDLAARASTLRQLELVCHLTGTPVGVLDPLRNPAVVHYCGHRIAAASEAGRFFPGEEPRVVAEIRASISDLGPVAGFGSLASGADVLAAEALLAAGAELHVWLPFDADEFVEVSVAPAGGDWVKRYHRCLGAAETVSIATHGPSLGDPVLFDYCARLAMGDALVRAGFLAAPVHQIAVWDGMPTGEAAGTSIDVGRWRAAGHPSTIIAPRPDADPLADEPTPTVRVIRALVFADVAGFSHLGDAEVARYDETVLAALADTIDGFGSHVLLRETWGDGIYLVLDDVSSAAACAAGMQRAFAATDLAALGLTALRGLRIAAHVGPVLQGWDPITGKPRFSGTHVTRAARIEPRTPEGAVYVTQQFAAMAALEASRSTTCQYVGRVPAAKDYGEVPMYVLHHRG